MLEEVTALTDSTSQVICNRLPSGKQLPRSSRYLSEKSEKLYQEAQRFNYVSFLSCRIEEMQRNGGIYGREI